MQWFRSIPILALLLTWRATAQEIDLVGETSWEQWSRRWLRIYAEEIVNNTSGYSGPLRLEIVATTNQPTGGNFDGSWTLGSLQLRSLRGGGHYYDLDYLVRYTGPKVPGLYYTSIVLDEYLDGTWYVADWEDFAGVVNFGGYGYGEAAASETHGPIFFEGNVGWESGFGRVTLWAGAIANEGSTRTGPLRLRLWATHTIYTGTVLNGYPLATKSLGRLKPGWGYDNYVRTAPFRVPPEGSYYTVLVLEERVRNGWYVRDWVNFPDQSLF